LKTKQPRFLDFPCAFPFFPGPYVLAGLGVLQCPQTAAFVVAIVAVHSSLIVALGKRVDLIQATPTWMRLGVLISVPSNPMIY
jgi:hypothetical protein